MAAIYTRHILLGSWRHGRHLRRVVVQLERASVEAAKFPGRRSTRTRLRLADGGRRLHEGDLVTSPCKGHFIA